MQVKQAINLAFEQVSNHGPVVKKTANNQLVAINTLCNLYGSAYVAAKWYRLGPIVESGASLGRILSQSIAIIKRGL